MQTMYTRSLTIMPSQVDAFGRLGFADTFELFMNVATEAAEALDVGMSMLRRRGLFWITVKTRVAFLDAPGLLERVEVETWPEPPEEKRCMRYYRISREGRPLVVGKTEWAITSALTHRPQKMAGIMPEGAEYPDEAVCPEPFPIIEEPFTEEPFAKHRVQPLDIDMARHMNNVAYVRAIINAFSVQEWKKLKVRAMDVIFRHSALEGETLLFRRRPWSGGLDIQGCLPDGKTSVLCRLYLG